MLSGLVACSLFFNPKFLTDFFGVAAPQHLVQIGLMYFGLAILLAPNLRSPLWSATAFVVLIWAIMTDWLYASFLIPFIVINLFVCGIYSSRTRRALLAALAVVGFGLIYAAGVYDAYDAFALMSVRLWGPTIWDDLPTSLLAFGGWPGLVFAPTFRIFAAAGILYYLLVWRRRVSPLAALTALYVAALVIVETDAAGPRVYWTLPILNYFERPLLPLYAILLVSAASDILAAAARTLHGILGKRLPSWPRLRRAHAYDHWLDIDHPLQLLPSA